MELQKLKTTTPEQGATRSPHWPIAMHEFKATHCDCIYCGPGSGALYGIQIHHIHPFHQVVGVGRADLELDPRNLTPLCESEKGRPAPDHHISEGHLGSFQKNNETVVTDAPRFVGQSRKMIEATTYWQDKSKAADKPFNQWTVEEKTAYRKKLDTDLPVDPAVIARFFPNGLPAPV